MRQLIVSMNVTLDGYASGPACELDWHFKYWTKEMGDVLCRHLANADTILLGRVTYNAMSGFWPSKAHDLQCRGEDFAFAKMMNSYRKIVFSQTMSHAAWSNTEIANGSLAKKIRALKKKQGKDIIIYGSVKLVAALREHNLIDQYRLWIHPVILGEGKRLFGSCKHPAHLKLIESVSFASGVKMLGYQTVPGNERL